MLSASSPLSNALKLELREPMDWVTNCSEAQDRLKSVPLDFYALLESDQEFTDEDFPMSKAFHWADLPAAGRYMEEPEWKRLSEVYPSSDGYSLFGENGVSPTDVD